MRTRWLSLVAFCICTALLGPALGTASAGPDDLADDYVVVKFSGGQHESLRKAGQPPTLADQGYKRLAVPKGK